MRLYVVWDRAKDKQNSLLKNNNRSVFLSIDLATLAWLGDDDLRI